MSASKTYASNRELGLNSNGVRVPFQHRGAIPPMAEGSDSHVVNDGGILKPKKDQKAWRVHCDEPGDFGGFDLAFGPNIFRSVMPGAAKVDFTVPADHGVHVSHVGMQSGWGPLFITRVW